MPDGLQTGGPVYCREFGNGAERAVMLHCALAHSKVWSPLADTLSAQLTMIAPDMPGHGRSGPWDRLSDIHDQVTAIARGCLGAGGHVIGHSFGATVALRLALENPDKVHSLTLIEPVLFAAARESDPIVLQAYLDRSKGFASALTQGAWAQAAQAFIAVWGDGRRWDHLGDREKALFASQMPFIQATEALLLHDTKGLLAAGRLEQITCPTRVLEGQNTDAVIPAIHTTLVRRIPGAMRAVMPGAGHMAPITHPAQVSSHISAMLMA